MKVCSSFFIEKFGNSLVYVLTKSRNIRETHSSSCSRRRGGRNPDHGYRGVGSPGTV